MLVVRMNMILKIKYSNNTSNITILLSLQGEIKL